MRALRCRTCGSPALTSLEAGHHRCEHCGAISVAQAPLVRELRRLFERLGGTRNAPLVALDADAAEAPLPTKGSLAARWILIGALVGTVVLIRGVIAAAVDVPKAAADAEPVGSDTAPTRRELEFSDLRGVVVKQGSSQRPFLLAHARNPTAQPLGTNMVELTRFSDSAASATHRAFFPPVVLMPGESVPVLLDLPATALSSRDELRADHPLRPSRSTPSPRLTFERVRLIEQGEVLRMVGRISNPLPDADLAEITVVVTASDATGAVVALGTHRASVERLAPGATTSLAVRLDRIGAGEIAAWDYRIGYAVVPAGGPAATAISRDRVVRIEAQAERLEAGLKVSTEALLADPAALFDPALLALGPLVPGRDHIGSRVFLTDVINLSADAAAVAPEAALTLYDGERRVGMATLGGTPGALAPGARFPVVLRAPRLTRVHADWVPLLKAPASRAVPTLEVGIGATRTIRGMTLLSTGERLPRMSIDVEGTVTNPGGDLVEAGRLWVILRDDADRPTGVAQVAHPPLPAGGSAPFSVRVEQHARAFATVSTLTEPQ